ncbi:MAG TPA: glycosyltransferase family 2 protein [Cyclobacteriaceae bacterium]|nr:glycosyltransferase family 2 protein [Cyclobacteriaceae bacterium]
MSSLPLVSIISINYNQLHHTCAMIESLRKISYPNIEIIIVDNASKESPKERLEKGFPEAILILSEDNLGFAGGNNLGIKKATGKYLLFLNNDTEVVPGFLEPLVNLFESNSSVGIASPKILYYNSGETIQYVGCERVNPYTGRNKRIGFKEIDHGQFDTLAETELAHGAAMMLPRAVIDKVGLMPELFFLYYEELDWCESVKNKGYKIFVVPQSKVYHKESMSIGKNSTLKTYYITRNRLLFMRRNTSGITKLSWIVFYIIFSIPKNSLKYFLSREFDQLKAFWKGSLWNITHLTNGNKIKFPA